MDQSEESFEWIYQLDDADRPHIRLFCSVDLIGSTAHKNTTVDAESMQRDGRKILVPNWVNSLSTFYESFSQIFLKHCNALHIDKKDRPEFYKSIGDELVYQCQINCSEDAARVVKAFTCAVNEFNLNNADELGVKGACWIAGFPINNTIVDAAVYITEKREDVDYIGPSIDAGFRISKNADRMKVILSVDTVYLLAHSAQTLITSFRYDGVEEYKGVLNKMSLPTIWIDTEFNKHPNLIEEFDYEKRKSASRVIDRDQAVEICETVFKNTVGTWLVKPYLKDDEKFQDMPEVHKDIYRKIKEIIDSEDDRVRRVSTNAEEKIEVRKEEAEKFEGSFEENIKELQSQRQGEESSDDQDDLDVQGLLWPDDP